MRYLEEWAHAKHFGQVGPQAGKLVISEEDILLNALGDIFHCAGIWEA
jgi:hypothetical protein